MPDINEWTLSVPGKADFLLGSIGTSSYPLSVQVDIGDVDISDQDQRHPTSDGVVMGKDTFGGFDITMNLKILPDDGVGVDKPNVALNLFSPFLAAWRADTIRKTPGVYATLANVKRGRLVYGRPRKVAPKFQRLRKGLIEYVALFTTNGPDWYGIVENSKTLAVVPPTVGFVQAPVHSPVTTANQTAPTYDTITNAGDVNAWPILEIKGPASNIAVSLVTPVGAPSQYTVWSINLPAALKTGETLYVDTRPWSRSAILGASTPANGRLRGSQLENCYIPPGTWRLRYDAIDPSAVSTVKCRWRDAYASM